MGQRWRALPAVLLCSWALSWGCAENDARLGDESPNDGPGTFTPPPDAASADANVDAPQALMCIGTTCPYPFATCPAESGPTYKCGADLSSDPKNCGSCGNECLVYAPLNMSSRCVDFVCQLECKSTLTEDNRNCNGNVDDGCEVDVMSDPHNCGTCGHECGDGVACRQGKCGCPFGYGECPDPFNPPQTICVNLRTDDNNCGACGNACDRFPEGACVPPNVVYGCVAGTCGHMKCDAPTGDCNGDIGTVGCTSDGCETPDVRTDPNNCGGCGIKCDVGAGEECVDEDGLGPQCVVPCSRFGQTSCPSGCVDLLNDVENCGGCGVVCRYPQNNEVRACTKGLCDVHCAPGFADCNGDPTDGCETNLLSNPGSCGACGNQCDIANGQPCIEGKCLMTTCEPGQTK